MDSVDRFVRKGISSWNFERLQKLQLKSVNNVRFLRLHKYCLGAILMPKPEYTGVSVI